MALVRQGLLPEVGMVNFVWIQKTGARALVNRPVSSVLGSGSLAVVGKPILPRLPGWQ